MCLSLCFGCSFRTAIFHSIPFHCVSVQTDGGYAIFDKGKGSKKFLKHEASGSQSFSMEI